MDTMVSTPKFRNMMIRWKMVDGLNDLNIKYKLKEFIDQNPSCTNDEIILFVEIICKVDELEEAAR